MPCVFLQPYKICWLKSLLVQTSVWWYETLHYYRSKSQVLLVYWLKLKPQVQLIELSSLGWSKNHVPKKMIAVHHFLQWNNFQYCHENVVYLTMFRYPVRTPTCFSSEIGQTCPPQHPPSAVQGTIRRSASQALRASQQVIGDHLREPRWQRGNGMLWTPIASKNQPKTTSGWAGLQILGPTGRVCFSDWSGSIPNFFCGQSS
jgi:hypothetical protein